MIQPIAIYWVLISRKSTTWAKSTSTANEGFMKIAILSRDSRLYSTNSLFEAAEKFLKAKHRRFPIVENGKLVGQISQKDILIAALEQKGENWK